MSNHIYGVVCSNGIHTDTSKSLQGAKNYATRHGYDKVSIRYNCGYTVAVIAEKLNGKWVPINE
jgi:hypothetical protein